MRGKAAGSEDIALEMRQRIETGLWQPGQRLPTERSLAEEFRVSRAQIQGAIDQLHGLGFIEQLPNCRPTVRDLQTPRRRRAKNGRDQVALWIHPNMEDLGAATILKGIRNSLGTVGYMAVIGCPESPQNQSEEAFLVALRKSSSVAGAIVWPGMENTVRAYQELATAGIPLVFVDREPPTPLQADMVATNNRRAARGAVQHLIGQGHRHIAIVSNTEDVSSVRDRIHGYRDALHEAGLEAPTAEPFRIPAGIGADAAERATEVIRSMLALGSRPTALFAVNDQVALHLYDAIHALGYRVPHDFSLIGFDWFMRWVPSGGHLTTVCQHFEEIGRIAVDLLLERIDSPPPHVARHIFVDAPLVDKGSTSPPALA